MVITETTLKDTTNKLIKNVEENKILKRALNMLLNKVNRVTAEHRHGFKVRTKFLDDLSNRQIDVEKMVENIDLWER